MAYDTDMYAIRIDGTLPGGETFSNTWTVDGTAGTPDVQDAIDDLHDFYTDLAAAAWTAQVSAVSAHWRKLNGTTHGDGSWTPITGANAGPNLPTECALRVSLTGIDGSRGGPFLAGFRAGDLDTNGTSAIASDIKDLVVALNTALTGHDFQLSIDKPTSSSVVAAAQVRVGEVFDVIRRRRNDLPENYATASL